MVTEPVEFFSDGERVSALWRTPTHPTGSELRVIVHAPGWSGEKGSTLYERFDAGLTAAGFAVLAFDYRGFGGSTPGTQHRSLSGQVRDLRSAIAFAGTVSGVARDNIGLFASGATGAAHAFTVARHEKSVRAVVSQYPIADGEAWIRSGLSMSEWESLLQIMATDRRHRVLTGSGETIARHSLRPRPSDRSQVALVSDLGQQGDHVPLSFVEELLEYRPIESAHRVKTPTLIIAAEGDTMTSEEDATQLYEALQGPRTLILLRKTTHSQAYVQYGDFVMARVTAWFEQYLRSPQVVISETGPNRLSSVQWID